MLEYILYGLGVYFGVGLMIMLAMWVGSYNARTAHGASVLFGYGFLALFLWPVGVVMFVLNGVYWLWGKIAGKW